MIGSFSDISILSHGGATGRTNLFSKNNVVFPGEASASLGSAGQINLREVKNG